MSEDLKAILYWRIKQAKEAPRDQFLVSVPDQLKEELFYRREEVIAYLKEQGVSTRSNDHESGYFGWNLVGRTDVPTELTGYTEQEMHNTVANKVSKNNFRLYIVKVN